MRISVHNANMDEVSGRLVLRANCECIPAELRKEDFDLDSVDCDSTVPLMGNLDFTNIPCHYDALTKFAVNHT